MLAIGIALGVALIAVAIWLVWPTRASDDPPPTPDEYWADMEADERARRGKE
ncbi:hypothetical protein [Steroidobacter cummioxidans]|uniref:hypothetical protein n=1 Tax=Steroidobacter cummioxidans TaxID=1803913 RepID=UPI00137A37FF|nr:hypothetical protein [Steroidobacter cummioxidans]